MRCYDKRVLSALAVVAVGAIAFAPANAWTIVPALVLLACPLSMLVMMRSMRNGNRCGTQLTTADSSDHEAEVQRLRAEIEDLRAQQDASTRQADPRRAP